MATPPRTYHPPMHHIRQINALQGVLRDIATRATDPDDLAAALAEIRSQAEQAADPEWAPAEALRVGRERSARIAAKAAEYARDDTP